MMFETLSKINARPAIWSCYTADKLWNDQYTSTQMLQYHLNPDLAVASRQHTFIDSSVAWLKRHFDLTSKSKVCDFGCGPGLYTSRLAEIGCKVTGIDFSEHSIGYAKEQAAQNGHNIHYLNQNYLEFVPTENYDLVTMIMCDFCALNPQQRQEMLTKMAKMLKDDGAVVLDVYTHQGYYEREEVAEYGFRSLHGFWSPNDYYGFQNTFKYDDEHVVLDKYSNFEAEREWVVYNWLQYFDLPTLTAEVQAAGLRVAEIYADVSGSPHNGEGSEMAVVLKR